LAQLSCTANDTKESVTYARLWGSTNQVADLLSRIIRADDANGVA